MNQFQLLAQLMSSKQNPKNIINNLIRQNPNCRAILNQMQQSGMNPKQFVEQIMKQNNIDFSQITQIANQNGIKL